MSVAPTSGTSLLAQAATLAKDAANAASSSTADGATSSGTTALSSLTSNFNTFLTLLTTQLQNQDPTSPMSSDTFTSELAQFAGVEQQVKTNSSLGQLISQGQSGALVGARALIGNTVSFSGNQFALQNGQASLQFSTPSSEPVAIAITDPSGKVVRTAEIDAAQGTNTWRWDGTSDSGGKLSDGTYVAAVVAADSSSTDNQISFTTTGTVTAIAAGADGSVEARLGAAELPVAKIGAVLAGSTGSAS